MGHVCDLDCWPSNVSIDQKKPRPGASPQSRFTFDVSVPRSKPLPRHQLPNSKIIAETPLVPSAVALAVWEEASVWLGAALPRLWITELSGRAEAVYAHNPRFRRLLNQRGDAGRDWLWAFTRHWLAGLLIKHRPFQAARLPAQYKIGRPLPGH